MEGSKERVEEVFLGVTSILRLNFRWCDTSHLSVVILESSLTEHDIEVHL